MAIAPPTFQFYAKDWNSSPTVLAMSLHDRGIYITLLSHAWDSEEPGTLPENLSLVSKITAIPLRNLRSFAVKWHQCFLKKDGKLVNDKLRQNWIRYCEIREKRVKGGKARQAAHAEQVLSSALALAPAPKRESTTPPTPPKGGNNSRNGNETLASPEFKAYGGRK